MMRRLLLVTCLPVLLVAQDPKEIVRRAVETDARNDEIARNYAYLERDAMTSTATVSFRQVTRQRIQTWEVMLLAGSPYRRLVARDDIPLSPSAQRKEDQRLRKIDAQRAKETSAQRQKRLADWERQRQKKREQNRDVPEAFDFRIEGEERLNGADVWVIAGTPHAGFRATTVAGRAILPKIACRFWISMTDYAWVKLDVDAVDAIWLAGFLLRFSKGSRIVVEQTWVNDEVWLPKRVTASIGARAMLLSSTQMEMQSDFSEYKKFQADSRIVGFQEKQ